MVDEGDAAVGGDPPERASQASGAAAEACEASSEVVGPPEKNPRAHAAPPSPSTASGAPREAGASGAAPALTSRCGDAGDEAAAQALAAGNTRTSSAPPLWKVCARPRFASALSSGPERAPPAMPQPRLSRLLVHALACVALCSSGRAISPLTVPHISASRQAASLMHGYPPTDDRLAFGMGVAV